MPQDLGASDAIPGKSSFSKNGPHEPPSGGTLGE